MNRKSGLVVRGLNGLILSRRRTFKATRSDEHRLMKALQLSVQAARTRSLDPAANSETATMVLEAAFRCLKPRHRGSL